ncbi:acidic mammalian chitinase, partial [Elysia marginata]
VCDRLKNQGWQSEWIEEQGVPFAYGGDQWAGFENKRSVTLKAKNIMKRDLGGAFVWSVEMGDFDGYCGQGPYPLIQAINDVIGHGGPTGPASKTHQDSVKPSTQLKLTSNKKRTKEEEDKFVSKDNLQQTKLKDHPSFSDRHGGKTRKNVLLNRSDRAKKQKSVGKVRTLKKIKWKPGNSHTRRRVKASSSARTNQSATPDQDEQFHGKIS